MNLLHDAAEFVDIHTDILANLGHVAAKFFDLVGRTFNQRLPASASLCAHFLKPVRVQLAALIFVDEFTTVNTGLVGELHHRAVDGHDAAVDAVKLVDQRFNTVAVQVKRVHQTNDFRAQFLVFLLFFACKGRVLI